MMGVHSPWNDTEREMPTTRGLQGLKILGEFPVFLSSRRHNQ